jgi:acetolactate synthase-1/2/3 large subunit
MVTGGGALFLNDALFKSKKIKKYFCHHEQACAMAAEAYYRSSLKPALVQVTTGPGGINAINGIFGAYVDSIPVIVISGQVKSENISKLTLPNLRQFGDQEVNITEIVKPITKYSKLIQTKDINAVNHILDEALFLSMEGRKGPVWIDVPIDIQGEIIDLKKSNKILLKKNYKIGKKESKQNINVKIDFILKKLKKAKRPVLICGNGIRFSNSYNLFRIIIKKLKIPVLTVWNSHDLIENDHDLYCGRPGLDGERAGNLVIQNSDLLIILGARMHVRQVGFNYKTFARKAYKIMIDIDQAELLKKNLNINYKVKTEINFFLTQLNLKIRKYNPTVPHISYLKN